MKPTRLLAAFALLIHFGSASAQGVHSPVGRDPVPDHHLVTLNSSDELARPEQSVADRSAGLPAEDDGMAADHVFDPALLTAIERDLGLSAEQLGVRLEAERVASDQSSALREALGNSYAGSWLSMGAEGAVELTVAVTDDQAEAMVRASGAHVHRLDRSIGELEFVQQYLQGVAGRAPADAIAAHYIDVKTNQVVVQVTTPFLDSVADLLARSSLDLDAIRVEEVVGLPRTAYDIRGGDRYNVPGGHCSIGFSVTQGSLQGYATAGHCATTGTSTTGFNGVAQGVFQGSSFPGVDHGWVRITNPAWVLRPWVNNYSGGNLQVIGETEAPVGAAICRSGTSSGYRCGAIVAKNVTVHYPQGAVHGLWRISACVTGGDSGGAVITPIGHAQGVTSGGLLQGGSNCHLSNPDTYIQPWLPIRNAYSLSLAGPQIEASYVPKNGSPRTSVFSSSGNPPPFDFYYDEWLGHFEQRPGGACQFGQENPTYLKIRARLQPGQPVTWCNFRASWDSAWVDCTNTHKNILNSGTWVTLNTDLYGRQSTQPCPFWSPPRLHLPFNQNAWFHINMTVGGTTHARRINFVKRRVRFEPPMPEIPNP